MILIKFKLFWYFHRYASALSLGKKRFEECKKSKQPNIVQYLKCWEDKTKKSYNITVKSKTSTPPLLNSRYPPLLYSCSVFPEGDLDWASPGTSSLCGCTSGAAAEAVQCSGSCHHQHGRTTCQSINRSKHNVS